MKKTMSSLKGEVMFMLEKYELLHEEITLGNTQEGLTITFVRKNDPRRFQQFIHYLNTENINYNAYFCGIKKRIKVSIYTE